MDKTPIILGIYGAPDEPESLESGEVVAIQSRANDPGGLP